MTPTDRACGCLLADAARDALGCSVEFDALKQICQRYGSNGTCDLIEIPCNDGLQNVNSLQESYPKS